MAAALLCQCSQLLGSAAPDVVAASEESAKAARLHTYARTVILDVRDALMEAWHLTAEQCDLVLNGLSSAVGPPQLWAFSYWLTVLQHYSARRE